MRAGPWRFLIRPVRVTDVMRGRAAWRCVVASGTRSCHCVRPRAGWEGGGVGEGAVDRSEKRRGSRARERNLGRPPARRPAPQPAFPARAECSASGLPGGWGRASAPAWAGRACGRGAGVAAGVGCLCGSSGAGAELPTSEVKRRRSGRRAPRRREHGAPVLDYSEDSARGRPTTSHGAHRAPAGEWAAPRCWPLWPSC